MICRYDGMSIQNKRSTNMDSLLLKEKQIVGQNLYMAVVCDGVGSMEAGAFASSMAVRMLSEWFDNITDTQRLGLCLRDQVAEINRRIVEAALARGLQTASTLSALLLDDGHYYIVHIGDSRIYCCRDGVLTQLTQDQTSNGKLTSCLGRKEKLSIFYNEGSFSGETFLLCSDGLYKRMEPEHLCTELAQVSRKTLKKTMERLMQYVIKRGEADNISLAILIHES